MLNVPKPHDPHAVALPQEVESAFRQALSQLAQTPAQEAAHLDAAHAVLRDALQDN